MDIEHHQLDLRYAELRHVDAWRERRLLASLAEHGQQVPVVVIPSDAMDRYILLDGYKRKRALLALRHDTVRAVLWDLPAQDALVLERLLRSADPDSPIEQGVLLCTLRDQHGLCLTELARRFDRSTSWVSRRIALVETLPDEVKERLQQGLIPPHAACKVFVPLARANRPDCVQLAAALTGPLTTRQCAVLYQCYQEASPSVRERLCQDPALFVRSYEESQLAAAPELTPGEQLLRDLESLAAIARRCDKLLRSGASRPLDQAQLDELHRAIAQARLDNDRLFTRYHKEYPDARPTQQRADPSPA